METKLKSPKEVLAGAAFAITGVVLFFAAQRYEIGTAISMGPGYFPALCGIVLAFLGVCGIIKGLRAKTLDLIAKHSHEPWVLILLSIVSFGLLIERAGLIVATFVCLFFACFRRVRRHPLETLAIFVVITAFNIIVFIRIFEMTIPLFPWSD